MKIRQFIFKQYNMGPGLGMAKDTFGRAMTYQAPVTLLLMLLTAYNTMMLREELRYITQWFNFLYFVGIIFFVVLLLMLFVWKVEMPSSIRMGNQQQFKHHNLLSQQIEEMEKKQNVRLDNIEQAIKNLEEKINDG